MTTQQQQQQQLSLRPLSVIAVELHNITHTFYTHTHT